MLDYRNDMVENFIVGSKGYKKLEKLIADLEKQVKAEAASSAEQSARLGSRLCWRLSHLRPVSSEGHAASGHAVVRRRIGRQDWRTR